MDPFMLFSSAVTLLGIVGDYKQYKSSKRQAARIEEIARDNARLQRMEVEEQERRMREEQKQVEGLNKARAAASGYRENKSAALYLQHVVDQHKKEIDWLQTSSEMRIDIMQKEASMEADAIRQAGKASLWNALGRTATAVFYAREAGLFSTKADLLRDASVMTQKPYWELPDKRYAVSNPWAPLPAGY